MKLSILDTQSPAHLPELLPALDRLGFHRYWATEHHSPGQSASPTIIASLAAGLTDQIRVGTAGVLLRATSPLRVAEDFATLGLFYPERLDLGIAGALPGEPYVTELLRGAPQASPDEYVDQVKRLVEMVRSRHVPGTSACIGPGSDTRPQLWLCGTSARAARLAGSLGISFAYHHYLASLGGLSDASVGDAYRTSFVSVDGTAPRMVVAAYGHCATSKERAVAEWRAYFGREAPQPSFIGTPTHAAAALVALAARYAADELAIDCFAPSLDERIHSLASLRTAMDDDHDVADVAQAT